MRFAVNYRYLLTELIELSDRLVLYPSMESMGDFTLRNEAALLTTIGSGWTFKVANLLDYDHAPPSQVRSTDSLFTVGLQYAF